MRTFLNSYRWSAACSALVRGRPVHAVRLWRRTALYSNAHFPGCPQHYRPEAECFDPDGLCKFARELTWRLRLRSSASRLGYRLRH